LVEVQAAVSRIQLYHSATRQQHIPWLLVPISLVSTLKSLLPPLASHEPTPGPDSTSTLFPNLTMRLPLTLPDSEAWRYTGPFSRWNRFKGSFPGLGIATVAFAGYLAYESFYLNDSHAHDDSADHH
jgi:hypothetical protein